MLAEVDEDARRARGFASHGIDEAWWRQVSLDLDQDVGGIVTSVRDRAPFAVFDAASSPNINQELASAVGARSAAFVPLLSEGRCTGVLAVASSEPRLFSSAEMELMVDLANETALALGRTRSKEELQAALDRERLLAEVSRRVRSELDLDALFRVAVEEVGRAVGVSRCFIRLGKEGGPLPVHAEWDAPGVGSLSSLAEHLPVSNLAAREGKTVAIDDVLTAPELDDSSLGGRDTLVDLGTHSVLATPILVFERMIGVFGLHRPEPGPGRLGTSRLPRRSRARSGSPSTPPSSCGRTSAGSRSKRRCSRPPRLVTSDLRFEAVIQRLVDELVALFGADAADCWIFDDGRKLLRCRAVHGLTRTGTSGAAIPARGNVQAGRSRPAVRFSSAISRRPRSPLPSADYAGLRGGHGRADDLARREPRRPRRLLARDGQFDSSDLEILDAFARFASLASHNAESFEERERQARIQRGFYRIAEVLGSSLSLAETLDALAQAAADALGATRPRVLEPRGEQPLCVRVARAARRPRPGQLGPGVAGRREPVRAQPPARTGS